MLNFYSRKENNEVKTIHNPQQQLSSLDFVEHPQHPWLVALVKSADLFSCVVPLQFY